MPIFSLAARISPIYGSKRFISLEVICGSRGFMNSIFRGAILLLVLSAPALAATSVDLNRDWLFRVDPTQIGATSGWQEKLPADTASVTLPHTWNIGRHDSYLGKAWYFRTFEMPVQAANLHVK